MNLPDPNIESLNTNEVIASLEEILRFLRPGELAKLSTRVASMKLKSLVSKLKMSISSAREISEEEINSVLNKMNEVEARASEILTKLEQGADVFTDKNITWITDIKQILGPEISEIRNTLWELSNTKKPESLEDSSSLERLILQDSGVCLYTSLNGFETLNDRLTVGQRVNQHLLPVFQHYIPAGGMFEIRALQDTLKKSGLSEVIAIRNESKKHSEIVENGLDEPAVSLTYFIPQQPEYWNDNMGRPGQTMMLKIVLPESSARVIVERLKQNPSAIRLIVKSVLINRFPQYDWEEAMESNRYTGHLPPWGKLDPKKIDLFES